MLDSASRTGQDQDLWVDWRATATGLELRSLAVVALAVPLLLAAGVYWLHKLPIGPNLRIDESNVIEVRLMGPQGRATEAQDSPSPPRQPTEPPAETLVPDPTRAIPTTATTSTPQPEQPMAHALASLAPASAPPVSRITLNKEKAATFQRALQSHIARFRHYPDRARREHARGIVGLLFSMQRDGSVTDVRIVSSSGYALLDTAAVETIRNAQPMPRIPAELPEQLNMRMPVEFDLPQ
jgi:periplasmic protein TonB